MKIQEKEREISLSSNLMLIDACLPSVPVISIPASHLL